MSLVVVRAPRGFGSLMIQYLPRVIGAPRSACISQIYARREAARTPCRRLELAFRVDQNLSELTDLADPARVHFRL